MKIALAFFGITRSLKYTIESIKNNVLGVLRDNGIEYDIFMHTYIVHNYINIRSREMNLHVDNEEYKLLNADYIEIDDQAETKRKINMSLYRSYPDPWFTLYNTVDNFILGQYSKSRLVHRIDKTNIHYDYIIYLRPDCSYVDKFDINFLKAVNDNTICIPNFHNYGKYKFNDRFCIANMKTYKIYGDIFKYLLSISRQQSLHSETVIGQIISAHHIKAIRIPFRFSRIRCDGRDHDKFKPR